MATGLTGGKWWWSMSSGFRSQACVEIIHKLDVKLDAWLVQHCELISCDRVGTRARQGRGQTIQGG